MTEIDRSRQTNSFLVPAEEFIQGAGTSWLIEDILPAGSLGLLYAQPADYKTFLSLGMARAVLAGEPFCGHETKSPGSVIYICLEGKGGAMRRVRGVCERLTPDQRSRFQVVKQSLRLPETSKDDWAKLVQDLCVFATDRGPIRLIIVDTFAQLSEAEENSSTGVGKVLSFLQQLVDKFGATVLVIHHEGKDAERGMRGSNALAGAADTILRAQRIGDQLVRLHCVKQKDSDEFKSFDIALEEVDLENKARTLVVKGIADPMSAAQRAISPMPIDRRAKLTAAKSSIVRTLESSPAGMGRGDLEARVRGECEVSEGTFTTALNELEAAGGIQSAAHGQWKLTPR